MLNKGDDDNATDESGKALADEDQISPADPDLKASIVESESDQFK